MQPKTKFDKQVVTSNERLTPISPKAIEWAVKHLIKHPAFRVRSGMTTCGDCGKLFRHEGKGLNVVCPHCNHKLEIKDTLRRNQKDSVYFATLSTIDGLQVERVSLLTAIFKKGVPMQFYNEEVCRLWLNAKGQSSVTSKARSMGIYRDCFNWGSKIELRGMTDVHHVLANTYVYPRYKVIPELKRNGLKSLLPNCNPYELMKSLLTDTRIETLMKSGNNKAVSYFLCNKGMLDKCWNSHKIAMRNGYKIEDYGLWCDLIKLLEKCRLDIRNAKYICPYNLRITHDLWLNKVTTKEEKRRKTEQLERAKKNEEEFIMNKSRYFGIIIRDEDIEISVLDSIKAYQAEGEAMHHCVFKCDYYNKVDTIVLSAHDHWGNRIETIEYSLTENKVIQSRGVCNKNTKFHNRIVNLVNTNAHRFIKAKQRHSSEMFEIQPSP